ncbi:MAG: hypothetical protein M9939_01620 [Mesorhizobium sp.]|nr:hypothetical protein [Mesorhizobium sp.]MCO5159808.1 hypothetical protein [Mesorhizobium sp.]
MSSEQFAATVQDLRLAIGSAVEAFLAERGIQVDWIGYYRDASTDEEQHAREILCFAGDLWPESEAA